MINKVKPINIPSYAHIKDVEVSSAFMGDNTITVQVEIDGDIKPDFSFDWVIEFRGERYVHPLRKPQASKENTSLYSSIDLTFTHWTELELKRYFFVEMTSIESGTAIPDKYIASLSLTLPDFITALNRVLEYYFGNTIRAELYPEWKSSPEPQTLSIQNTYIWDLLPEIYKAYAVHWRIVADEENSSRSVIRFGFPNDELDHIFEYGFKGGLLKVERQVQSDDIRNIILGRGGETNIPYRYFKDTDPDNPSFPSDPDWIPELANIYFTELRDSAFRSYVQGWKAKHYEGTTTREQAAVPWAYDRGYTDIKFNPVEYVKDDESIATYGERYAALGNNSDIYPTLQGLEIEPYGRIDEVVAVRKILSDDVESSVKSDAVVSDFSYKPTATVIIDPEGRSDVVLRSENFTIDLGKTGNIDEGPKTFKVTEQRAKVWNVIVNDYSLSDDPLVITVPIGDYYIEAEDCYIVAVNAVTGEVVPAAGIPSGTYHFEIHMTLHNTLKDSRVSVTVSCETPRLTTATIDDSKWTDTWEIWVKNIWGTAKKLNETAEQYASRVWGEILGDKENNEAKVVFSTGLLSISEDYEFTIVKTPEYDESQQHGGVKSHWKLTLAKSDADLEATGQYIPNTRINAMAGDYFYFIGIDLPYLYYTEAEKRLTAYKQDELGKVKEIKPTWVVTLDKIRIGLLQEGETDLLLNSLVAGASLRLSDARFIDSPYEVLYIQSVKYKFSSSNKDSGLLPDVEIVLSDEYETTANPISTLSGEVSALAKQVGAISNVEQIIRAVGDKLYLRKDGISDRSMSPTEFLTLVTSVGFRAGIVGGAGWGIFKDENGKWVFEVDKINAREDIQTNSLVINTIESRGGMIVESAAAIEVTFVAETNDSYICYFDQKDGTVANLFHLDDVAYCQRFNPDNSELKLYKRRVTAVGVNTITLTKGYNESDGDTGVYGDGIPEIGDTIVHYGNYIDKTRQYAKVRDVINGGYERYIEGLDSVNATGTEYYYVGRSYGRYGGKPRWFIGDYNGDYLEYLNGTLNIKGRLSINSMVGEDSLEEYIKKVSPPVEQEDIEGFVNNIVDPKIENLQDQIDGVIETYFYNGVPSLERYPANQWTTDELKIAHLGDLYYDNDTGTAYRFSQNEEGVYFWNVITDDAITKALAAAQKAQDTADSKRRTFTSQPTRAQAYDIGDIWVNATFAELYNNDLLRAIQAKASGNEFDINHWTLASKYTDDTTANKALDKINDVSSELGSLSRTIDSMRDFTDDAFSDGIIDISEASAIENLLNNIETTRKDVEQAYTSAVSNSLLPTGQKQALDNAKATFDAALNSLVVAITNVISDGVATSEERALVNSHYQTFNDAYGSFVYAINEAVNAIMGNLDININKLSYLSTALKQSTTITGGLILSSIISLGKNNTDFTTQTTYSGLSGIYDSTKRGGGIAAWYGGDMIDKFDYYDSITGEFNVPEGTRTAAGVDRMDGTGYRANGNLWWDATGKVHADPLSFFVGEDTVGALLASFQVVLESDGKTPDYVIPQVPFDNLAIADSLYIGTKEHRVRVYKTEDDVLIIDGNLAVTGGITMYADGGVTTSLIDKVYSVLDPDMFGIVGDYITITGAVGSGKVNGIIVNGMTFATVDKDGNIMLPNYPTSLPASDVYAWAKAETKPTYVWDEIGDKPTAFTPIAHTHSFASLAGKPTTLAGYGITDAKISAGVITLGSNTITPLTAASSLAWSKLTGVPSTFAPSAHTHTVADITDSSMLVKAYGYEARNAVYMKLGTLSIPQGGYAAELKILSSSGYNAKLSQRRSATLHIRSSNGNTADSNGLYAAFQLESDYYGCYNVYVVQNSQTSYDIWLDQVSYTGRMMTSFIGNPNDGVAFTSSQETASSLPSNAVLVSSVQHAYIDSNVKSASQLQYARTINGTEFNGTANIVTAKWGNARTIALSGSVIGSASVDGSGDVTITTTTNHTHPYLPLAGGTMTGQIKFGGIGSQFRTARDAAMVRLTNSGSFYTLASLKTTNGTWDISHYTYSGFDDTMMFNFVTDEDYDAGNNVVNSFVRFSAGGNILASGGITMYSDVRLKNIIGNVILKTEDIANAPLFIHTYKHDKNQSLHVGTSAQYWQKLYEDCFTRDDGNGYLQMEIQNLGVAMGISLARNLQEYKTDNDDKVKALEKRIKVLENIIIKLKEGRVD